MRKASRNLICPELSVAEARAITVLLGRPTARLQPAGPQAVTGVLHDAEVMGWLDAEFKGRAGTFIRELVDRLDRTVLAGERDLRNLAFTRNELRLIDFAFAYAIPAKATSDDVLAATGLTRRRADHLRYMLRLERSLARQLRQHRGGERREVVALASAARDMRRGRGVDFSATVTFVTCPERALLEDALSIAADRPPLSVYRADIGRARSAYDQTQVASLVDLRAEARTAQVGVGR